MADGENERKGGMNAFAAALTGLAVGAAAVFLSDKKNRDKLKKSADQLFQKGDEQLNKVRNKLSDATEKGKDKLANELESASGNLRKNSKKRGSEDEEK